MVAGFGPGLIGKTAAHVGFGFKLVGPGHMGHFGIDVMQAFFVLLERGGQTENRTALLAGDDAAVGEAAAIEIALDLELGLMLFAPAAQEIGVERMRRARRIDRQLGGAQRLRNDLPAEHPAHPVALLAADEVIVALRLDLKQFDETRNELCGGVLGIHGGALRCD